VKRLAAALVCAASLAVPATGHAAAPSPVVDWNHFLLGLQAAAGVQPATVHPTYELAVVHQAILGAVDSTHRGASRDAAADAAAHDTLVALYPTQKAAIDQEYATELGRVGDRHAKAGGVATGRRAAAQILRARRNDGSTAAPLPFTPDTNPGDYQLTAPGFAQPVFTHWSHVKPFALRSAAQFRPPAPPAITSPKYLAALDEVQALGSAQNSTRTADQTQIGVFWNPPIWATWNRIAGTVASGRISEDARAFAALNVTLADSVIAFYDAKYTYRIWRPITALRALRDPSWTPLSNTAPDPSYPGAHGTVSAGAADVLAAFHGNRTPFTVDSTALPGVLREFTSFSEAAQEASVSRIYNGNHTRVDQVAGENLGHDIASWVLSRRLR
jgi:PAP2 superfamily